MEYLEQYKKDIESIYKSIGITAFFKEKEIKILPIQEYDFETFSGEIYSVMISKVPSLQIDDELIIDGISFKLQNYRHKNKEKIEYIIGLIEND